MIVLVVAVVAVVIAVAVVCLGINSQSDAALSSSDRAMLQEEQKDNNETVDPGDEEGSTEVGSDQRSLSSSDTSGSVPQLQVRTATQYSEFNLPFQVLRHLLR